MSPAGAPITLPTVREDPVDPPSALGEIRAKSPLVRLAFTDGHTGWLVTSHALARAVLGDKRISVCKSMERSPVDNSVRKAAFAKLAAEGNPRVASGYAGNFLNMDPPDHTFFRRMLAPEFTLAKMEALRPRIVELVEKHLDALESAGPPADLVESFAAPIPSLAICDLLGIPIGVREMFQGYSTIIDDPRVSPDALAAAYAEFVEFMYRMVRDDEVRSGDALIARLAARDDLTTDDIVGVGTLLVSAGHQTTANMMSLSVFALLEEHERWEKLQSDPEAIPVAVEELLRFLTIFQLGALTRTALEDIVIEDVTIRAGESVFVSLPAANRDPGRFEDADRLDLSRPAAGHLAFGHGIHVCLGQHLARIEIEAGLAGLLGRFPDLRLAVAADDVPMHPGYESQAGPYELPVTW